MSDEPVNRAATGVRDPQTGQFLAGNRSGGRPELPQWFKDKGPEALQHLWAVAEGTEKDERISRAMACEKVIERVYGRVPATPEDSDSREAFWAEMLERLRTGGKP